jgi:SNF2 family DNA or RNA helicase
LWRLFQVRACHDQHASGLVLICAVVDNWRDECRRFAPGLRVVKYAGEKDERASLQGELAAGDRLPCDVILTSFEMCLRDADFLSNIKCAPLGERVQRACY